MQSNIRRLYGSVSSPSGELPWRNPTGLYSVADLNANNNNNSNNNNAEGDSDSDEENYCRCDEQSLNRNNSNARPSAGNQSTVHFSARPTISYTATTARPSGKSGTSYYPGADEDDITPASVTPQLSGVDYDLMPFKHKYDERDDCDMTLRRGFTHGHDVTIGKDEPWGTGGCQWGGDTYLLLRGVDQKGKRCEKEISLVEKGDKQKSAHDLLLLGDGLLRVGESITNSQYNAVLLPSDQWCDCKSPPPPPEPPGRFDINHNVVPKDTLYAAEALRAMDMAGNNSTTAPPHQNNGKQYPTGGEQKQRMGKSPPQVRYMDTAQRLPHKEANVSFFNAPPQQTRPTSINPSRQQYYQADTAQHNMQQQPVYHGQQNIQWQPSLQQEQNPATWSWPAQEDVWDTVCARCKSAGYRRAPASRYRRPSSGRWNCEICGAEQVPRVERILQADRDGEDEAMARYREYQAAMAAQEEQQQANAIAEMERKRHDYSNVLNPPGNIDNSYSAEAAMPRSILKNSMSRFSIPPYVSWPGKTRAPSRSPIKMQQQKKRHSKRIPQARANVNVNNNVSRKDTTPRIVREKPRRNAVRRKPVSQQPLRPPTFLPPLGAVSSQLGTGMLANVMFNIKDMFNV